MANNLYPYEDSEDDFIDMEVGSYINFFDGSPPSPGEFEFQMSSNSLSKDTSTSPADELFYQGKLLPLHLPPRLQMVEKMLQRSTSHVPRADAFEDFFSTPLVTAVNTPTTTSTPFESCNISPSESFRRELNQEEYMSEYANGMSDFVTENNPAKSKAKRPKSSSLLALKLKASKAFLKSLFSKSGCSHESSAAAFRNTTQEGSVHKKAKDSSSNASKKVVAKKASFGQIQKENSICQTSAEVVIGSFGDKDGEGGGRHRRSFSGVIKHRLTTTKSISFSSTSSTSSSSSSSSDSIGFQELPCFKRSSNAGSDIEISIKGAIAHCKQSQKTRHSTTALTELQASLNMIV
uniref:Membrane-associated kinase regulator 4 n=1 Tax=Kalanchoe fedtschenkoi TaxID=63787 RepID=A0A7N0TMF7_KALFE